MLTTSPVPLHATFTDLDVRVANTESKSRIRAAVSEFVDRHPDVHYFHSYEMVVTAERQSDYYRDDGRHVHRHAVRYIVSEFLRLFADPVLHLADVDGSWLTPIEQDAADPDEGTSTGEAAGTGLAPVRQAGEASGPQRGRSRLDRPQPAVDQPAPSRSTCRSPTSRPVDELTVSTTRLAVP